MCVKIFKSGNHIVLNKTKNDGHVEAVSFGPNAAPKVLKAMQFLGGAKYGASVKTNGIVIRVCDDQKYMTIRDRDVIIFIPREDIGSTITQVAASI